MDYNRIKEEWNKFADEFNSWDNLGEEEKVEFAFSLGLRSGLNNNYGFPEKFRH